MKTYNIFKIFVLILILSTSCLNDSEFLDRKPLGEYSEVDVWQDPVLASTFVNGIYRDALGFPFAIQLLGCFTDEMHNTADFGVNNYVNSLITPDGLEGWDKSWATPHTIHFLWDNLYGVVRKTNMFFSKVESVQFENDEEKNTMLGEVYFLRGLAYHYLTSMYGGVPIVRKVYGLDDEYLVPRDSYKDCVNFIVEQLDSAAMFLPLQNEEGRATKGAAMAIKARCLLYAASDIHNNMDTYAPGYSNPELLGYTDGNPSERWQAAKQASKDIIDLGIYDLVNNNPSLDDNISENIFQYFLSKNMTTEDIFIQKYTTKTDESWNGYVMGLGNGPNGYHLWGNNCPIGEFVDSYEYNDGTIFDWNNPQHKAAPFKNRDARLYASVLIEGMKWNTRPSDALQIDPWSRIQVGSIYDKSGKLLVAGLDTRISPIEPFNGTYTGYYIRKYIDPTIDYQFDKGDTPFRHIRYAEVLLNYVESCIELGQYDEARIFLNKIRKRAGQPELTTETGGILKERYRNERKIELAFEDHRFWDVHRWLLGPVAYQQTHSIDIKYFVDEPVTSYRKSDGSLWSEPVYDKIVNTADKRSWNNKMYFFPIYRKEINRNNLLIQNPGY
jgi:hypothetical protein